MPDRDAGHQTLRHFQREMLQRQRRVSRLLQNGAHHRKIDLGPAFLPLTQHGDDQDTKTDVDMVRDMSAIGVSWCNWGGAAADVASAVDEIRRFGDTVIAKVR